MGAVCPHEKFPLQENRMNRVIISAFGHIVIVLQAPLGKLTWVERKVCRETVAAILQRIGRIFAQRIAALLGTPMNTRWTLDKRPYGKGFFLSLGTINGSSRPFEHYMSRYFK